MKTLKRIPKFKTQKQEAEFWQKHDSADYIDFSKAKRAAFPNLKPSTKSISIRLPEGLIERLKILANQKDIPYQSLIKLYLPERVTQESK